MINNDEDLGPTLKVALNYDVPVSRKENANIFAIGDEQYGKYESFILPNIEKMLGSYVVVDEDEKISEQTSDMLRANGYNIKYLYLNSKCAYNPLKFVKSDMDVRVVANLIGKKNKTVAGDIFYEDLCEMVLQVAINYILKTKPEDEQNLLEVMKLVEYLKEQGLEALNEILMKLDDATSKMNQETFDKVLNLTKSKFDGVGKNQLANISENITFDFSEITNQKTILYVNLSESQVINGLFFTHLTEALNSIADNGKGYLEVPTFCFLDRFEKIGYISLFEMRLRTTRSRKIMYGVIINQIGNLQEIYGKSTMNSIIKGCDIGLFLGTADDETVKFFVENIEGVVSFEELKELHPKMCVTYETGLAPIKLCKVGVEPPSIEELEEHSQQLAEMKELEQMQKLGERAENRENIIAKLDEQIRNENDPDKKAKLQKIIDTLKMF